MKIKSHLIHMFASAGLTTLLFFGAAVQAQNPTITIDKDGLKNESELGLISAHGNTRSETLSFKQQNAYRWETDNTLKARYFRLRSKSNDVENAKQWDAALRYERNLSERFGAYASQGIENNIYAGFEERLNSDIGARYTLKKTENSDWKAEIGYRYTDETRINAPDIWDHRGRAYSEFVRKLNETSSLKFWVEYLPSLSDSEDYQANGEASVTSALSSLLSLKVSYLVKYTNQPAAAVSRQDTLLTTSLVATF